MNALFVVLAAAVLFLLAYRFYGKLIAQKVLGLDPGRITPAQEINDGIDYVPTRPAVLFGHHFASIAGLGPIIGPAIAVVWGWLPAILWVVFGTIFIGAVHDFAVLGISVRHRGRSIGDITHEVLGPRARLLFMLIILFAIVLAMGVFILVIKDLFSYYGADVAARAHPEAVLPSLGLIVVATAIGYLIYKKNLPFGPTIAVGVILMFVLLFAGIYFPIFIEFKQFWVFLLLGYAFLASVLPVWLMLQPRDFLSSFNLYAMLILLTLALFFANPGIAAPALNTAAMNNPGAHLPDLVPFLFITIACGAVSGFHCMVSSGTSSKQLRNEKDARIIGYGGMLTEGFLAVLVIIGCVAGYSAAQWGQLYSGWLGDAGIGIKIGAFVTGAANIAASLGIPPVVGSTFFAVTIVAFALTTLDTGTRLTRYTLEELFRIMRLPAFFTNRYTASTVAVVMIGYFALMELGGKPAGLALWKLFGTSNQLLAGIALLVATVYFFKQKRPTWFTFLPMVFMLSITTWALSASLIGWVEAGVENNLPLIVVGGVILLLLAWLVIEAIVGFAVFSRQRRSLESTVPAGSE
ncbi:MAG TPA: carbon starvation protein A [Acidobacteriota bacterium]|nr:carbon starvation protein A [Acidobacteriota bacterium]